MLDVDAGFGEALVARLQPVPAAHQGRDRPAEPGALVGRSGAAAPGRRPRRRRRRWSCRPAWPGVDGVDLLGADRRRPPASPSSARGDLERSGSPTACRPWAPSSPSDTIPAEAGQWLIDASVSFTKGCYTGQELVARIDSRGGNVPRPVRLLVVDGEFPVAPGRRGPRRRPAGRHGHQRHAAAVARPPRPGAGAAGPVGRRRAPPSRSRRSRAGCRPASSSRRSWAMPRPEPTHYDVLGVDPTASAAEIRKAYLQLARDHHPDFHSTASDAYRLANEREMQRINEAWTVLSDPDRREGLRRPLPASRSARSAGPGPAPPTTTSAPSTTAPTSTTRPSSTTRRWPAPRCRGPSRSCPPVLLLGGAFVFVVGALVKLAPLVAIGIIGVMLGLLGFLAAPAMAIARSLQAERDP